MPNGSKSRYTVRARPDGRYCVWDNEGNNIANSPNGDRHYSDLGFDEAFNVADRLRQQQPDNGKKE
jgi:hypothetical protein